VSFGRIEHEGLQQIADTDRREISLFVPLVIATLIFGVWPMPILDITAASVENLVSNYQDALSTHAANALLSGVTESPR
ncbi:MAG: NADH-quinone oxidoreductase subunit M, partial [Pseudomonadota bacterium]|nr:NADH-quinone oxidoreductase subunit M [Pseudomonadota bacterium]